MNKLSLLIIIGVVLYIPIKAQVKVIDSIFVYKSFDEKGYTTAGVSSRFRELKENHIELLTIKEKDKNKIISILNNSKCNKHWQTKFGGGMIFCLFIINNKITNFIIENRSMVDLSNYKNYWFKDEADEIWIKKFKEKIKREN